jgi:hypothetical protein
VARGVKPLLVPEVANKLLAFRYEIPLKVIDGVVLKITGKVI